MEENQNQFDIYSSYGTAVEEAYKSLRANIQFCEVDKKIKSITITSCNATEGKTTTSFNIAISMAQSGMKVLLIDGDMRKPSVYKNSRTHSREGLSNYLSGYSEFEQIIKPTTVENCYFMSCGVKPPNPAELIGSKKFGELLLKAEEAFDLVIIDTPPLGSVIDAALMAAKTSGTIIVINSREISYKQVIRVKEQLEKANATILGVVLNKVKRGDYKNYYHNYGYYENYSYSSRNLFRKQKKRKRHSLPSQKFTVVDE